MYHSSKLSFTMKWLALYRREATGKQKEEGDAV